MHAASTVTVAQLERFLTSSRAHKRSDQEIAEKLSRVDLSEELTSTSLARIVAESSPGPDTAQQLEILAAASTLQPPPASELPAIPTPDQTTQNRILAIARENAQHSLHILPDLLALRETQSFNNLPLGAIKRHQRPRIEMRFAGETRREIAVRKGREVGTAATEQTASLPSGLSTWGEFGAMLTVIFRDSSDASMQWNRWQTSDSGTQLAVFAYKVPRLDSHYTIDFCCYRESQDDPTDHSFRDQPGYHGEIFIDPATGEIARITLNAELSDSDPVSRSAIAVQYGHVMIGGRSYLCPVGGVAVSELYNPDMQKDYGIAVERHVNKVAFTHYHKFGSTARILTGVN
ncbi:hypothetical protein [Occallatibacter savannae]|uniref:hypothetical protein n=1 Tax=Occallatibacter savannae TaxID=1002691 RepID=UPI00195289C1|nr:hypothetical protein [Occallatibacter savannae]